MKILFILEHFYPYIGGAEQLFYVLSTSLVKEGYEIVVVTTLHDKKLLPEEIHKGVKIIRVSCWNRFAFTFFSFPKVLKYARSCDIIHTTTYNAALPAIISGKIFRKPVFVTFHEVWGSLWKTLPFTSTVQKYGFYYFEKLLLKLPFTKFIAVSEFTKEKLQQHGVSGNKIIRIYNGIDYRSFDHLKHMPNDIFTFTYFGRLGISKGLDLLIPAAARFIKNFPKSKLKLIIPKYPMALFNKIMKLVKDHDLENFIDFQHNLSRADLYQELLHSSCVVIPSYSEGFCFAAAEAVALKVPVISSHQGALTEVVSGKFITMDHMGANSLVSALAQAYRQKWTISPIRYFPLDETIANYKRLYRYENTFEA